MGHKSPSYAVSPRSTTTNIGSSPLQAIPRPSSTAETSMLLRIPKCAYPELCYFATLSACFSDGASLPHGLQMAAKQASCSHTIIPTRRRERGRSSLGEPAWGGCGIFSGRSPADTPPCRTGSLDCHFRAGWRGAWQTRGVVNGPEEPLSAPALGSVMSPLEGSPGEARRLPARGSQAQPQRSCPHCLPAPRIYFLLWHPQQAAI